MSYGICVGLSLFVGYVIGQYRERKKYKTKIKSFYISSITKIK